MSDGDEYYYILNIPPSTYNVQSSFVGFATVTTQNIRVVRNQTSIVSFELREEAIVGWELVVVAERSIVEMDRTTTTAVIDAEQLEVLPVTNVRDAINLQTGVVDGHFRGGRSVEVTYLINGVPITNAFSKNTAFENDSSEFAVDCIMHWFDTEG
ncbi:MAG: TonB-dependent receptor plug domain-containing protein [Rhodothermaceae bacterium]|nr:TonB-dependent receptor plug domain-containing protein [Rhodothermaceae bacterium]